MDNNNLNNLSLGSGKIKQISIAEKIDQRKIMITIIRSKKVLPFF